MTNFNKTICNLHFLVLNNVGNADNKLFTNRKIKLTDLSWLKKAYLNKAVSIFGDKIPLVEKKGFIYWRRGAMSKKRFFNLLPSVNQLTIKKSQCNYYMREYSRVVIDLVKSDVLKKQIRKNNFGCVSHDSITWGVTTVPELITFFPQKTVADVRKNISTRWNKYFTDDFRRKSFLAIDPKYHFGWRNKLIPAHEIVHNVNKFNYVDEHSIARCEWVASASNVNIYLGYLKNKFHKLTKSKLKKLVQLEALGAVLYVVELLNSISNIVTGDKNLPIINEWVNSGVAENSSTITDILQAKEPLWRNTYSKHLAAIVYAYSFFEDYNSRGFTKKCMDDSIWTEFEKNIPDRFQLNFWNETTTDKALANWIVAIPPTHMPKGYAFIVNPITNDRVSVNSALGRIILNKFLVNLKQ